MSGTIKNSKVTDTTENLIVTNSESTAKNNTEVTRKNTETTNDGRTILKTKKLLDPIEPPAQTTIKTPLLKDSFARIDDVIEIAKRIEKSNPNNFNIVFEAAMKIYFMSNFRSSNNMTIEVSV